MINEFSWNEDLKRLVLAADQFIVKRGDLRHDHCWLSLVCGLGQRYDDIFTRFMPGNRKV